MQFLRQIFAQFVQELECGEVVCGLDVGHALDANGQILGHESGLDCLHTGVLEGVTEFGLQIRSIRNTLRNWKSVEIKLMPLGVANRIVVIESKSVSEFDRRFQSDSKSNDEIESTIAISK